MEMVIFMKDNGQMIWQMDMVHILMLVVPNMKVNGSMISSMEWE
jgi:hypothetical protein